MGNKLLITEDEKGILTAWAEENRICRLQAEAGSQARILGNIYVGRVQNIVKNLNAAFVEFSKGQNGYLPLAKEGQAIVTGGSGQQNGRVQIGSEVLVQVKQEASKTKPPALSALLEFAGRYVIVSVGGSRVSISRKIKDKKSRERLQGLLDRYCVDGFRILARTNSEAASDAEIAAEIEALKNSLGQMIARGKHAARYTCLYQSPPAYLEAALDLYNSGEWEILTDSDRIFAQVWDFFQERAWEDSPLLTRWDDTNGKMDAVYDISRTLKKALNPKVWLKNGAYLVIQPTEALVSIDVNTGKAVSKNRDVQKGFLKVNLLAAEEIAVQLRLRNLSGMILVDFIDMEALEDRQELLRVLRRELSKDPIPTTLVDMTKLGLVEITRKKAQKPLYEQVADRVPELH